MITDLIADLIRCPGCRGPLSGRAEGRDPAHLTCAPCSLRVPVRGRRVDLSAWSREASLQDGAYWGRFYRQAWESGYTGFTDPTGSPSPLIHLGVTEGLPAGIPDERTAFLDRALDAAGSSGGTAIDLGCGAGWSAVHLARRGMRVVAVDPSRDAIDLLVDLADREDLEIIGVVGGVDAIHLAPARFDLLVSCHAMHHMGETSTWLPSILEGLTPTAWMVIEDHVHEDPRLVEFWSAIMELAREEILPTYQDPQILERLGPDPSPEEGSGVHTTLGHLKAVVEPRIEEYRYVVLDIVPFLVFLSRDRDPGAYAAARGCVDLIHRALARVAPDAQEYVRLAGPVRPDGRAPDPVPDPDPPTIDLDALPAREIVRLLADVPRQVLRRALRRIRRFSGSP